MFPGTHSAIIEMIGNALLETHMARSIVRKGAPRLGVGTTAALFPADLLQTYAHVDTSGLTHSQYGSIVSYTLATVVSFPAIGSSLMTRFWDFADIEYIRLVANITEVGPAGGVLQLTLFQPEGSVPFEDGNPSVPADSVGFHDSGWKRALWLTEPGEAGDRPAQTVASLTNPTGLSGTMGVGLCQVLVKGA